MRMSPLKKFLGPGTWTAKYQLVREIIVRDFVLRTLAESKCFGRKSAPHKLGDLFRNVGRRLDLENRLSCQSVHRYRFPFRSGFRLVQYHGVSTVQELAGGVFEVF